ncbi:hypothetical protein RB595_004905 [Gaeumannomyces hyphopodioides]
MALANDAFFVLSPLCGRARDMVNLAENDSLRLDATLRICAKQPIRAGSKPAIIAYMGSDDNQCDVIIRGPGIEPVQCAFLLRSDNGIVMFVDCSRGKTSRASHTAFSPEPKPRMVALSPEFNTSIRMGAPGSGRMRFRISWPDSPYPKPRYSDVWRMCMLLSPESLVPEIRTKPEPKMFSPARRKEHAIRYEELGAVGRNTRGLVSKVVDVDTGNLLAVKTIRNGGPTCQKERTLLCRQLRDEAEILKECQHPHIVELMGLQEEEKPWLPIPIPVLLMRLKEGDVWDLAEPFRKDHRLKRWLYYLADTVNLHMLRALAFLAKKGLAHRDVRPENILFVSGPDSLCFQLTDFGGAMRWSDARYSPDSDDGAGTPCYMAPERIWEHLKGPLPRDAEEFCKQDVWGLLVTLLWMVEGDDLIEGDDLVATHLAPALKHCEMLEQIEQPATMPHLREATSKFYVAAEAWGQTGRGTRWMPMAWREPARRVSAAAMLAIVSPQAPSNPRLRMLFSRLLEFLNQR